MRITRKLGGPEIQREYVSIRDGLARCVANVTLFDPAPYQPAAVHALQDVWRIRMATEHQSSTVFLSLCLQMYEANATADAQAVMTRMAIDELRHGEICADVLRAIGQEPVCELPEEAPRLANHPGVSREERALRNVVYHCAMTETVNVARFVDTLDRTTDPFLRDALRLLLADEIQHGSFGFQYLAAWAPWLAERPDVRASLERFLTYAFAFFEQAMKGPTGDMRKLTPDELALGLPDPSRLSPTLYETLEGAIVPGLERCGLDAGRAYRQRRLDAT